MLDICLLGTGGMMPLPYRWLTSMMARYNGTSILMDCGEGTQIAMKEKGWNNVTLFKTVQALTENNFLEVKGLEKAVKTYARKLAPSMTRAEYYGNLLASRGITKEDLPQIIASVIGTEKDSVEKEIDEMLQRL